MKTILIATDNFLPRVDGIARFLEMFVPFLSKYRVIIVAPDFKDKDIEQLDKKKKRESEKNRIKTKESENNFTKKHLECSIHRVPMYSFSIGDYQIPRRPKEIGDLVRQADLIFSQTIGPVGSAVIAEGHRQKKAILAYVHSIEWSLVEKSLASWNPFRTLAAYLTKLHAYMTYNKCSGLIVPSTNVGEIFSFRGIRKPKFVVPLGIDTNIFRPMGEDIRATIQKKYTIPKENFVVGYVGRIAREKDLLTLLGGFKRIEGTDNTLLIIGDGIPSLKRKLLHERVILAGKQDDIVPFLNAIDTFVMPSLTETTCLAVLEAMACEVPVVSTKVGSIRTYLTHNVTGFFFPKKNPTLLGLRLNHIKTHIHSAKKVGKKARETVVTEHDWSETVQRLLRIIEDHVK